MAFDGLIVETLLPAWPLLDRATRETVARQAIASVTRAISIAPFHVRLGAAVLSAAIGLLLVAIFIGAGGPAMRAARADRVYRMLQRLPGPQAAVIRLYRSLSLLAFYEHPAVAALLTMQRGHSSEVRP